MANIDPELCRRLAGCESTPVEVANQLAAAADLYEAYRDRPARERLDEMRDLLDKARDERDAARVEVAALRGGIRGILAWPSMGGLVFAAVRKTLRHLIGE